MSGCSTSYHLPIRSRSFVFHRPRQSVPEALVSAPTVGRHTYRSPTIPSSVSAVTDRRISIGTPRVAAVKICTMVPITDSNWKLLPGEPPKSPSRTPPHAPHTPSDHIARNPDAWRPAPPTTTSVPKPPQTALGILSASCAHPSIPRPPAAAPPAARLTGSAASLSPRYASAAATA
jgi:hypothetical protein